MNRNLWFLVLIESLLWSVAAAGAPPPTDTLRLRILVKMIPAQKIWFKANILAPFEKERKVLISVDSFEDYNDLEKKLQDDASYDVVKTPIDRAFSLCEKGFVAPADAEFSANEISAIQQAYLLPTLTFYQDSLYYLPRKFETRIVVYRKSKVREAVSAYQDYKDDLDQGLKAIGGAGLPKGYTLEVDPNDWDYYDMLMAGYTWYKKESVGRVGLRGKNYSGTFLNVIDRAFQLGATRGEIPFLSSGPVNDAFLWEHVNARFKVYNPRMFKENWAGMELWQAFGRGDIYLSFFTQLDCFFMLGTGENGLTGYFKDASDVDFALMPMAVSLKNEINPMFNRNITTNGWLWGIGRKSSHKKMAAALIMHMTALANQDLEFKAFGALPTRGELLKENNDRLYLERWRNRLLQTSARQIRINRQTVLPALPDMDKLEKTYLATLREVCLDPGRFANLDAVSKWVSAADSAAR